LLPKKNGAPIPHRGAVHFFGYADSSIG